MKKIIPFIAFGLLSIATSAQINWQKGGNFSTPPGSTPSLGTAAGYNAPLNIITNGVNRARLNATLTTPINGVTQNVDGYFGIGPNGYFAANSPKTMLHLQGPDNTTSGGSAFGWRSWMKTGMLVVENSDAMYVGMKNQGPGINKSDAVIAWSDDPSAASNGPDKLRFIFTRTATNPTSTNPLDPTSLPGCLFI